MRIQLLGVLLLGAALLTSAAPPPEPLCRVSASSITSPFRPLRKVIVKLRDCAPNGHAFVRLQSSSGATDPVYGWRELNAARPGFTFTGVLPHWKPQWEAASGLAYTVPELRINR